MAKALIAMSGGVDSAVAAWLTQQAGFDCLGATLVLLQGDDGSNCLDAESVCRRLKIPFHAIGLEDAFACRVIHPFVAAYEAGCTPNPCVLCNRHLKFGALLQQAQAMGCEKLVTGHYARIEKSGDRYLLKKGLDAAKDQSYVLYALTQQQLAHTLFPLGELTKEQARSIALQQGFVSANRPDSQDICFIPDGDYAGFIRRHTGRDYPQGDFVDTQGNVLGQHKGLIHYTVGQRRGLGVSAATPLYVKQLDTQNNQVVLCTAQELFQKTAVAGDFNWIAMDAPSGPVRCRARARYHQPEQPATAYAEADGTVRVEFDQAQRALTPGQAIVLYDGDTLLGGGTILYSV